MPYSILTVDDSRTIRMIVKKAFKSYDCVLHEAENGVEGLAMAAKVNPDLIILDITMPVMTGIEMLGKLSEDATLKKIPVIMLTAESGKDNVMQIVKMGVKDYIVKPFKGEQLIERASQIIDLTICINDDNTTTESSENNHFGFDGDIVSFSMPAKISRSVGAKVESAIKAKIDQMNGTGVRKFIVDLTQISDISMNAIQLIISVVNNCAKAKLQVRLVATENQSASLKSFHETSSLNAFPTLDAARDSF